MPSFFTSGNIPPGLLAARETASNEFCWGPREMRLYKQVLVNSAAADSGNTPTTELRAGLAMGLIAATGLAKQWDPTATDGTQILAGYLAHTVKMVDVDAVAQAQVAFLVVSAPIKNAKVYPAITQIQRLNGADRFIYDDDLPGNTMGWRDVVAKTADYTLVATDNNKIFTTRGAVAAVNFTLPTIIKGFRARFFNEAGQNMTITAAVADTLVVFNDLAADSIAYSTVAELIGGGFEIFANDNATKWLVLVMLGSETQTPTIVT